MFQKVFSSVSQGLVSWQTVASASGAVFLLMLAAIYVSIVEKQYNIVSYDFKPKVRLKAPLLSAGHCQS